MGRRRRRKSVTYRLQDQFLNIAIRVAIYPVVLVIMNTILTGMFARHACVSMADAQLVTSICRPRAPLPAARNTGFTSCTTSSTAAGTYSSRLWVLSLASRHTKLTSGWNLCRPRTAEGDADRMENFAGENQTARAEGAGEYCSLPRTMQKSMTTGGRGRWRYGFRFSTGLGPRSRLARPLSSDPVSLTRWRSSPCPS
jgi:hypothetical protein